LFYSSTHIQGTPSLTSGEAPTKENQRKPKKTIESVLVVFLDIRSTSLAKMIIDIDIYDNAFDQFVRKVWEVRKLLAHNTAAVIEGTRETPITTKETKSVKDTAMFDPDDD
jgi:abortive infection bacteriophage resistance protein